MGTERGNKTRERESLVVAVVAVTIALVWIGLTNLTTWKFDVAIIGSFLFGDYVLRWLLRRREKTGFRTPEVFGLAFRYGWFFVLVLLAGEIAFLAAVIAGVLYGGSLSPLLIVLLSTALTLALALDFITNYRK